MFVHHIVDKKRVPVILLFLAGVLLTAWFVQFFLMDFFYQSIRERMVNAALLKVSENINQDDLEKTLSKICSQGIEVRIVDSEGIDWINLGRTSLTEYTQEQLSSLYQNEVPSDGTVWEYLAKTDAVSTNNSYKDPNSYTLTCAKTAEWKNGIKLLILVRAVITPEKATMSVVRIQIFCVSATLFLSAIFACLFLRKKFCGEIEILCKTAQKQASGDFNSIFPVQGCADTKKLAKSLNQAANSFVQAKQNQEEYLSNISHDLRAPLTMMIGYAQMMQEIPGENTPENAQIIMNEANRLSVLVNDILDLSKMKEGEPLLKLETFCLTDLLQETVYHYQKLTAQKQWEISFEKDRRVWVKADQIKISRVIYNFICNAINHTGQDKKIRVQQLVQDKKVFVRVTDNGPGIAEDKISSIWDRYYRIEQENRTSAAEGSGLGLCIVKNILQQHQAEYGVESKQNQGSTFWFALEVLDQQQAEKFVKKQNQ